MGVWVKAKCKESNFHLIFYNVRVSFPEFSPSVVVPRRWSQHLPKIHIGYIEYIPSECHDNHFHSYKNKYVPKREKK